MAYAPVDWSDPQQPFNLRYEDYYYSKHGALEESDYVFINGNHLLERWRGQEIFRIGELGFGAGLNFLNTYGHWRRAPQAPRRLEYFSFEQEPLAPGVMKKILGEHPRLRPYLPELLEQMPPPLPGIYLLSFAGGQVNLYLLQGDARHTLVQFPNQVDAWFLDGFAPKRNPELWEAGLMKQLAAHTSAGGSFATYSAASQVRQNLQAAGFAVQSQSGFGQKREMLVGRLEKSLSPFSSSWGPTPKITSPKRAMIVGAGIAGCSLAHALSREGWEVYLYDSRKRPAQEASGNSGAILYPQISVDLDYQAEFSWAGFHYSRQVIAELRKQGHAIAGGRPGMLILDQRPGDQDRFEKFLNKYGLPPEWLRGVSPEEATEIAGIRIKHGGLFFPQGTWVNPQELCEAWLQGAGIHFRGGTQVAAVEAHGPQWVLKNLKGESIDQGEHLFLANALGLAPLLPQKDWHFTPVKGQSSHWPNSPATPSPQAILCGKGYAIPLGNGDLEWGATFERKFSHPEVSEWGKEQNWNTLLNMWTDCPQNRPQTELKHRSALRACTRNRWPHVGPHLEKPGIYYSSGHGSKGLLYAPLGGLALSQWLHGRGIALPQLTLQKLLDP